MKTTQMKQALAEHRAQSAFSYLYGGDTALQEKRYIRTIEKFEEMFGEREIQLFSAPGRSEIGGNHTDHQHGRVLAAGVDLDVIGAVSPNDTEIITIQSEGHKKDAIDLAHLECVEEEANSAAALIRGIASRFTQLGLKIGGFDAYTTSNVLKGSGLSSSAAFEVLVGTILNHLYNGGQMDPVEIAKIGQYAENVYFKKPSGLLDQTAASVGSFVTVDFRDNDRPVVKKVSFDLASCGYALCVVDTKGSHADLTGDYAAITAEMKSVAAFLGKEVLRDTDEALFYEKLAEIRKACSDRAVLRAMHFYEEDRRVPQMVEALHAGDFERFKELIIASGRSSYMYLQNVFSVSCPLEQGVSLGLALCEKLLAGKGAWRVHGGGFAGTIQAFVPQDMLEEFQKQMEAVMGEGTCHILHIRPVGGVKISLD